MKGLPATNVSLENLYTLDPQDEPATNDEERARMKKYLNAVMETVLTDRQRRVLKIYYSLDKPSFEKVGKILKLNKSTVREIYNAAIKKLEVHKNIFSKMVG